MHTSSHGGRSRASEQHTVNSAQDHHPLPYVPGLPQKRRPERRVRRHLRLPRVVDVHQARVGVAPVAVQVVVVSEQRRKQALQPKPSVGVPVKHRHERGGRAV